MRKSDAKFNLARLDVLIDLYKCFERLTLAIAILYAFAYMNFYKLLN